LKDFVKTENKLGFEQETIRKAMRNFRLTHNLIETKTLTECCVKNDFGLIASTLLMTLVTLYSLT